MSYEISPVGELVDNQMAVETIKLISEMRNHFDALLEVVGAAEAAKGLYKDLYNNSAKAPIHARTPLGEALKKLEKI